MLKRSTILTFFVLLSAATFAQTTSTTVTPDKTIPQRRRNEPRPYALTITNNTKIILDTSRVNVAFKATYPAFAVADGYRTKREVTMRGH